MFLHIREAELVQDKALMSNNIQTLGRIAKITLKIDKIHSISIRSPLKIRIKIFHPQSVGRVLINQEWEQILKKL